MTSNKMADTEVDSTTDESANFTTFHSSGAGDNGIEGDIHIPVPSDDEDELNTLDEPVSETLVCTVYLKTITAETQLALPSSSQPPLFSLHFSAVTVYT